MTVKPGNYYIGKITGEFKLENIYKNNGKPIFEITNLHESTIQLTLEEMREEKPKAI